LRTLQDELDKAVAVAYGFSKDDDVLAQLLALNQSIADQERSGLTEPGDLATKVLLGQSAPAAESSRPFSATSPNRGAACDGRWGGRASRRYGSRVAGDLPDFLSASGWQRADDAHPSGEGAPAYRVVYKTLKTYLPEVNMLWPNLVLRTTHGSVNRGGMRLPGVLPLRREGHWLLPQPGETVIEGTTMTFRPSETKNFEFQAWEEEVDGLFFVELVLHTTAENADRRLAEGRSRLASLKTLIELSFGPRVLGALVTEELGEAFPDGHFNRSIHSDALGNEWQMGLAAVTPEQASEWTKAALANHLQRPKAKLERIGLACDWYWRSTQTSDPVTEYLELWFVIEVIAMPDTTDVRLVRERLAAAFGGSAGEWRDFVGRHYGRRSNLVHGDIKREVEGQDVESLRDLAQALLEVEFGIANPERGDRLRLCAGIGPVS
jgi:hypothetical protein